MLLNNASCHGDNANHSNVACNGAESLSIESWSALEKFRHVIGNVASAALSVFHHHDHNERHDQPNVVAKGSEMRTADGTLALHEFTLTNNAQDRANNSNYANAGDQGPMPQEQRRSTIKDALMESGQPPNEANIKAVNTIVQKESGWDPDVVNHWDSNARKGTPSKGLMQVIDPTFDRYSLPGHKNIHDPDDNLIAGIRYAVARYGSLQNVPGIRALGRGHRYRGY